MVDALGVMQVMVTARAGENEASHKGDGDDTAERVLAVDVTDFPETDWPEKIAKANEARRAGQEARKGKPIAFGPMRSRTR